jgi:hypothetical protein
LCYWDPKHVVSLTTGLLLGLLLGMRHALEPDHLAAVSTLVVARGRNLSGTVLGALWGIGHSVALLAVGCTLAVLHARMPDAFARGFELLVGLMLVTLGTRAILRSRVRTQVGHVHPHASQSEHVHVRGWTLARRPLAVGLIHGLAGSGALTALVMAEMPNLTARLTYIVLFGIGSIAGMALLTGVAGWPLARLGRSGPFGRSLATATGAFSVLFGGWWGWSALAGLLAI